MSEQNPQPDFSSPPETQTVYNSFYNATARNQAVFREKGQGTFGYHEMPRVSEKIEQNMKRVFAGHLDPTYPRVILARRVLSDTYTPTDTPFFEYNARYPETMKEENRLAYDQGMHALNEWATNHAVNRNIKLCTFSTKPEN